MSYKYFSKWDIPTNYKELDKDNPLHGINKDEALDLLEENIKKMSLLQDKLYAQNKYGVLLLIQGSDTCGKDGLIKHVMTGLNPQSTTVHSFKVPSKEELNHDYLWRYSKSLPERGTIGIFNRSYYEEVLVVKVHNLLVSQNIPDKLITDDIWDQRYEQINNFEKYLTQNGIVPIKIFLNLSKDEQKKRLLDRIEDTSKNWKFSDADIKEREYWDDYQKCYKKIFKETNTDYSKWYNVPADKKWFARLLVSEIIVERLEKLNLDFPTVKNPESLQEYKKILLSE